MKDIGLIVQEPHRLRMLESLQKWSVQCMLNMTSPEIVLAYHFIALGFKQAGTRFLPMQKQPASDNTLGSVRHLPHIHPRPGGTEFGEVSLSGVCGSCSTVLVSPHAYWPGISFTSLPLDEYVPSHAPSLALPFHDAEPTERFSTAIQPLPSLSLNFRKLNAIYSQLLL